MAFFRPTKRAATRELALAVTAFHAAAWGSVAGVASAMPSFISPASAQSSRFAPVRAFSFYRLENADAAVHEGAQVRLVDTTRQGAAIGILLSPRTPKSQPCPDRANVDQVAAAHGLNAPYMAEPPQASLCAGQSAPFSQEEGLARREPTTVSFIQPRR
jgi:hypothetical protein